jgi:hypothetical protein
LYSLLHVCEEASIDPYFFAFFSFSIKGSMLKKLHIAIGRFLMFLLAPAWEIESERRVNEARELNKLLNKGRAERRAVIDAIRMDKPK